MSENHRNIVVLVVMFCVFYDVLRKAKHPANDVYCPSPARVLQVKYNRREIKTTISFFSRKMKDTLSPFVNYISKSNLQQSRSHCVAIKFSFFHRCSRAHFNFLFRSNVVWNPGSFITSTIWNLDFPVFSTLSQELSLNISQNQTICKRRTLT